MKFGINKHLKFINTIFIFFTMLSTVYPNTLRTAAPFTLKDSNNQLVKLEKILEERSVLILFWATWCSPCIKEMVDIKKEIYKKYDTSIIAISIDTKKDQPKIDRFIRRYKLPFTFLYDQDKRVFNKFKVNGIPAAVIISKNGEILYEREGFNVNTIKNIKSILPKKSTINLSAHSK